MANITKGSTAEADTGAPPGPGLISYSGQLVIGMMVRSSTVAPPSSARAISSMIAFAIVPVAVYVSSTPSITLASGCKLSACSTSRHTSNISCNRLGWEQRWWPESHCHKCLLSWTSYTNSLEGWSNRCSCRETFVMFRRYWCSGPHNKTSLCAHSQNRQRVKRTFEKGPGAVDALTRAIERQRSREAVIRCPAATTSVNICCS